MKHHSTVLFTGLLLLWSSAVACGAERRLNVLFIAADDLRADLGCYGHPLAKTPHLDKLARRGVLFERAYCQQALCNPSRTSLLTGQRPDTLGIWNLPKHFREVDPKLVTLPEAFRRQGYFTRNIGKVFHNWRQEIKGDPQSWSVPAVMHFARHDDDKPRVEGELPPNLATARRCEQRDVGDDAYFDGRIADLAVEALGELSKRDEPFFLAVGFWKPHLPFNPPKKYWDRYDSGSIRLPRFGKPPVGAPAIALHNGRELLRTAKQPLSNAQIKELRRGYLAGISYLDAQVGKVLQELERLRLRENTVVVFWSDHGFHLGEHSLWCKTSNFEHDAHVPLIIAAPNANRPGAKTAALVELLDLYPTLVDLCEVTTPTKLEGVSLRPLLIDSTAVVKRAAYTQHPRPAYYQGRPDAMGVSVRTDRYRYTEWRKFDSGEVVARELYDHQLDPGENLNTVDSPADAEQFQVAQRLLLEKFPRGRRSNGLRE